MLLGAQIGASQGRSAPPYVPFLTNFSGTTNWLDRTSAMAGAVDHAKGTFFARVKKDSSIDGATAMIMNLASGALQPHFNTSNKFKLLGRTAGNTLVLDVESNTAFTESSGELAVLCSWNLDVAGSLRLYINDQDEKNQLTFTTSNDIDFTDVSNSIGSNVTAIWGIGWTGCLGQIWFEDGVYFDFDTESERRKFNGANGAAKDLGVTGAGPTGFDPLIWLDGIPEDWHTNKGTGGGFTENGTLAACP